MTHADHAQWHALVEATQPSAALRNWLTLDTSLTARLCAHAARFTVRRLHQHLALPLPDECAALGLPPDEPVHEREVLLYCDDVPVVFAHTVMPALKPPADWPDFHALGEQSLGALLFDDPQVTRGDLQFSHLPQEHPLMLRIHSTLPSERIESRLHARRCLFLRNQARMLVTEVFLPGMTNLN